MQKQVSILGCGWLGFPLAKALLTQNYTVKGSTTRLEKIAQIQATGIQAYHIELSPSLQGDESFFDTDYLIINIPPRLRWREAAFHLEQIKTLVEIIGRKSIKKIIFISSTSVYPELNREVFESDAQVESSILVEAENLLLEKFTDKLLILRFGGLMGYDRIPAKYFAGWKGLTTGNIPVNFLHRDDAVDIICKCLEENIIGIYNALAPKHPVRRLVYEKNCQELGFEAPEFVETPPQPFKIVSVQKLLSATNYQFKYPDPLDFYYEK